MIVNGSELNGHLYRGPSKDSSYQGLIHLASGFRGDNFKKLAIQKQELPVAAMFVNGSDKISNL